MHLLSPFEPSIKSQLGGQGEMETHLLSSLPPLPARGAGWGLQARVGVCDKGTFRSGRAHRLVGGRQPRGLTASKQLATCVSWD